MKVVLFCGGFGTRLREYSEQIPKPLVPVGNLPIIVHLMKYYSFYGHNDFILCLGYRGDMISQYFLDYEPRLHSDFRLNLGSGESQLLTKMQTNWNITFRDTGLNSNIGQRLVAVRDDVSNEEFFLGNYSDALTDLQLDEMISNFRQSSAVAAFLATRPSISFSGIEFDNEGFVTGIDYLSNSAFVNGGFFIFRPEIFDYIKDGEELVEEPFGRLISDRKLLCHRFEGFWNAMDTFKDKKHFDALHEQGTRLWEVWT